MFDDLMPLNFDDPTPISLPVTVGGKSYTLTEASEFHVNQWTNRKMAAVKYGDDFKVTGLGDVTDADTYLLSLCLKDDKGNPVPLDELLGWKARVTKPLIARLKLISDLEQPENAAQIEKQIKQLQDRLAKLKEPGKNA